MRNTLFAAGIALALVASACGGEDLSAELSYEDEGLAQELVAADTATQAMIVRGADLVGEIVSCGYASITVRIRNRGDLATDARACSIIGCTDRFESWVFTGATTQHIWSDNLAAGETKTVVVPKPAGREGRISIRVDTWGSSPGHSVAESNENNNYTESYCVL